jgi:hypothetical protein
VSVAAAAMATAASAASVATDITSKLWSDIRGSTFAAGNQSQ